MAGREQSHEGELKEKLFILMTSSDNRAAKEAYMVWGRGRL